MSRSSYAEAILTKLVSLLIGMLLLLGIGFGPAGPGPAWGEERKLTPVSLIPLWVPQAQFAGYMVALEKGYYHQAGLEMTLLPGGPGKSALDMLKNGEATFAVAWLSSAMQRRAAGEPLINLAQIVQKSSLMLVARRSAGLTGPDDLQSKKIGLWGGDIELPAKAFFQMFGITIKPVPQYYSVDLFLRGGVDAASAMLYNEYHLLIDSGLDPDELTTFLLSDYGIMFPEDGLYVREDTWRANPDLCRSFVKASLDGWRYAFAHQEEALDIVMKQAEAANQGTNRAHQRWMLARMADLIQPPTNHVVPGRLSPRDYEYVGRVLLNMNLIQNLPAFEDFCPAAP